MAGDQLTVDAEAIVQIASGLTTSGYSLPTEVAVDGSGAHSAAVSSAAESFAMWATVQTMLTTGQVTGAAQTASDAASTWYDVQAQLDEQARIDAQAQPNEDGN